MASILKDKGGSATEEQKAEAQAQISDYASIPTEYQEAVKTAFALGLITGYADGTFGGSKTMNRAQGCIVIDRLAQYVGADPGTISEIPVATDPEIVPNIPPNQPAEQVPSTTADSGSLTLRDGSAVTEENVLKIIDEVLQVYPNGAVWDGSYNTGKGLRDNDASIGDRTLGSVSPALIQIKNTYDVSMGRGCGGFAGVVSDAIFGGSGNGGENFPIRKLDSVTEIRPGDILVKLDANGKSQHILTAASRVTGTQDYNGTVLYRFTVYDGNNSDRVHYGSGRISDELVKGIRYEAWTRYPD